MVVPGHAQGTDDLAPGSLRVSVADRAERPGAVAYPLVRLTVENAVQAHVGGIHVRVLGVRVEDGARVAERANGLHWLDSLPEEVARVEVGADLGAGGVAQAQQRLGV